MWFVFSLHLPVKEVMVYLPLSSGIIPMFKTKLQDSRRYIGWALLAIVPITLVWCFSPGLPVLIGPWAWDGEKTRGGELFSHVWTPGDSLAGGDGLGPVGPCRQLGCLSDPESVTRSQSPEEHHDHQLEHCAAPGPTS